MLSGSPWAVAPPAMLDPSTTVVQAVHYPVLTGQPFVGTLKSKHLGTQQITVSITTQNGAVFSGEVVSTAPSAGGIDYNISGKILAHNRVKLVLTPATPTTVTKAVVTGKLKITAETITVNGQYRAFAGAKVIDHGRFHIAR
jgi:hypothetical protein